MVRASEDCPIGAFMYSSHCIVGFLIYFVQCKKLGFEDCGTLEKILCVGRIKMSVLILEVV